MENKNNQVEKPITMVIEDTIMKELHNEIHISYLKQAQMEAENYNKSVSKEN